MAQDLSNHEPIWNDGFNAYAGPFLFHKNHAVLELRNEHLNGGGFVHGGLMMAFVDTAMAKSASDAAGGAHCATMTLNSDFLAAGKPGMALEAFVEITRQTRSIIFATGRVEQDGQLLLTASGVMKIIKAPE